MFQNNVSKPEDDLIGTSYYRKFTSEKDQK